MSLRIGLAGVIAAAALVALQGPAGAWDQLDLGTSPTGRSTFAPSGGLNFKDLPGVQRDRQQLQAADGDCAQDRYFSAARPGFDNSGTVTECNFGRFSVRTYRQGSANSGSGYNPFPTPGPLQQGGAPPGSGGFAPRQQW